MQFLLSLEVCILATCPAWADSEQLKAPLLSNPDAETFLVTIPAPRGLIVDRHGEVLARNRTVERASLVFQDLELEDPSDAAHYILDTLSLLPETGFLVNGLDYDAIYHHLEHRPLLPLVFTRPLEEAQKAVLQESPLGGSLRYQVEYLREYPLGKSACHIVGFVTRDEPRAFGPILPLESLWPPVVGREGVEQTMDEVLSGREGVLNVLYENEGKVRREQMIREPEPGQTLVLSISTRMQKLAERILAEGGRPGALVAIDSTTGDILAMASNPGYDLSHFVDGISAQDFAAIQKGEGDPFYPRAFAGQYPPGSTYKPIVSLAALTLGPVQGAATLYACGPSLDIDGRTFHNWNTSESGYYDVRQAIMRSTNTWFYQAGINTGSAAILQVSQYFGLGAAPQIPLDNVAAGNLPEKVVGNRAVANLSIGQGALLISPLQMAIAMGGLANSSYLPSPRLILQTQTPPPQETVVSVAATSAKRQLPFSSSDMRLVHQGMWGVVNSSRGTGGRALMEWPQVYGKTGTAQWTKDGDERNLSWFSGFVNSFSPRIAFAVVCEGKSGETLSGGKIAAPMAGEFLRTIYGDPKTYEIDVPRRPEHLPVVYYENTYDAVPALRNFRPPVNNGRSNRRSPFPQGWGIRR